LRVSFLVKAGEALVKASKVAELAACRLEAIAGAVGLTVAELISVASTAATIGSTVYGTVKSGQLETQKEKAAAALEKQQTADAAAREKQQVADTAKANEDQTAQAMKARIAALYGQGANAGLSADYFTKDLQTEFPGFDNLAAQVVSGSYPQTSSTG
jgi:hypothetical protein